MKWITLLAVLALLLAGCGNLNETFVKAVDSQWTAVAPGYTRYVKADPNLPEASKTRRLKAIEEFNALVAEAKADIEKED